MLATLDLVLYGFLAVVLLPIVLVSLITGSKQPDASPVAKYYRAEPSLGLTSNLFLLVLCIKAVAKLAQPLGYLGAAAALKVDRWTEVPFLLLLIAVLVLWLRAVRKVRRAGKDTAA